MNPKNIFLPILSVCWMFILFSFSGCTDEYEENRITNGKTATVTLDLLVPGASSGMQTRAMNDAQEAAINNLQVLVFEETGSGEVYRDIIKEVKKDSETQVTLKLPVSKAKYRFVVLANASTQTIADGTPKKDALNKFTFACAGIWNAEGANSQPIPMWGEYKETISIQNDQNISIMLHRALARVDVGLKFKSQDQDNQTDEVERLDNFKIASVRVYRTKNLAYVGTDKIINDEKATEPNIPGGAKFNPGDYETLEKADANPLVYTLKETDDKNSYVREIYIPESFDASGKPSMDEVPCLVIGGYYGKDNKTEITYYRADFADYEEGKVKNYKSILRNNRYVFNIKSVSSPGFKEPEQALNSITTGLNLTVHQWQEIPLNIYMNGSYFYQIDSRDVVLEARTNDVAVFPFESVPYTTNLNLNSGNVKYSWGQLQDGQKVEEGKDSSSHFDVAFDYTGKTITFTAKQNNVGTQTGKAKELNDILNLQVGSFQLTIRVKQKAVNVSYELLCNKTKVEGKYREGVPLDYTHYLEMQLEFTDTPSPTDEIEITSETRKGIYFSFKGTINEMKHISGEKYEVRVQGYGTPVKDPNDREEKSKDDTDPKSVMLPIYNMVVNSNSTTGSSCDGITILFGYKTKRILAIGANASYRYGYQLEPNTGSRAFVDASINFGVDPNSTVTMEQFPNDYTHPNRDRYDHPSDASARGNAFHIEYMTTGRGIGAGDKIDYGYLEKMMTNFKPHIILTGQAIQYQKDDIERFNKFINDGGVFLMFNEYYPKEESINAMVSKVMGKDMGGSSQTTGYDQIVYDILDVENNIDNKEDPILRGPFSGKDAQGNPISLAKAKWGSDGICVYGFANVNSTNAYVYSKRQYEKEIKDQEIACIFRHKTKPFFFIGDGGFISNSKRYIGDSYQGSYVYCPFAIGSAYQPLDRVNYTNDKNQTVVNSRFFGNILTWAVDYAEFHGIKYDID